MNSHVRPSPPLVLACLQGQKSQGGVRFLVLKTYCYQKCKRPNALFRFGSTFGPDPAPGGPVFTFRTACYYRSFAKSLDFGVQKKDTVGSAILRPPRLGLACLKEQKSAPPFHIGFGNMPTLAVEAAKSKSPRDLFSGPPNELIHEKTSSNTRSEK